MIYIITFHFWSLFLSYFQKFSSASESDDGDIGSHKLDTLELNKPMLEAIKERLRKANESGKSDVIDDTDSNSNVSVGSIVDESEAVR